MTAVHDRPRVRGELPRTSVAATVRVAATALAPVVARGVLARRPRVVALAEWLDADRRAGRLPTRLRARYGDGPLRLRDEERLPYADVFTPRIWLDGTARANWQLVPFSGGHAECPGRNLVLLVTSLFLAGLLRGHEYRQAGGRSLAAERPLPRTPSPFRLRLGARPRVC